ncbi:MAG: hypothetical protein KAY37_05285 [Phycisphaerae bacterium]|nr:hypothetical protein [Phycisphaerae bacterium]
MIREISLRPIGIIHSPHEAAEKTPIQPALATGIGGASFMGCLSERLLPVEFE